MDKFIVFLTWLLFLQGLHSITIDQQYVDDVAAGLHIYWRVVTNTKSMASNDIELTMTNNATNVLNNGSNWGIYFDTPMMVEPGILPEKEAILKDQGIKLKHWKGTHYVISPTTDFIDLKPGSLRKIKFRLAAWTVSRTDSFPNWYISIEGFTPRVIANTVGESLDYVVDFTSPNQWKRATTDTYNPFSPQQRYMRYMKPQSTATHPRIIPKPLYIDISSSTKLNVDLTWQIFSTQQLTKQAQYLNEKMGLPIATSAPTEKVIELNIGDVIHPTTRQRLTNTEAYRFHVDSTSKRIVITGTTEAGVFYGIQTLLALFDTNNDVFVTTVVDQPRFEYRGMHLDVARNFHSKASVLQLLDAMATYKLNKLHFHLSDDEGWRLEIPGLPELTQIGATRCFEPTCLLPQLGSGPTNSTSGSGHYTVTDYQEILTYAADRHIHVIPEFDMPGHARAAIKAMEDRYSKLKMQGNMAEAEEYILTDLNDTSKYWSVQNFDDNAVNPCLNTTYAFLSHVLDEVKKLHANIQPLTLYHYGGDEVGNGAWVNSTKCREISLSKDVSSDDIKELFFRRVVNLTGEKDLHLGAWEDGVMKGEDPFNFTGPHKDMYAYSWNNIWEWGGAGHAHRLANAGYKVIMAQATHLYFDHPYEPDPVERGYYWAPRFADAKKTFGFMPANLYENIDVTRFGKPLTKEDVCGAENEHCPALTKPENVAGMQGHLWSETVRTTDQLNYMIFPRLLAVAERAWHKADWETEGNKITRGALIDADWADFSKAVGERELPRLDSMDIKFRVSPPGARVENGKLMVNTEYSDQVVVYSKDNGLTWIIPTEETMINQPILLKSRTPDGKRESRITTLYPVEPLPIVDQSVIDYIADYLSIEYEVLNNFDSGLDTYLAEYILKNVGDKDIVLGNWEIYFYSIYMVEPRYLKGGLPYELPGYNVILQHVNGGLFKLTPSRSFGVMRPGESRNFQIRVEYWSVAKSDVMPNIYVTAEGMTSKTIKSTAGESLSFVHDYVRMNQWKRYNTENFKDRFDPFTLNHRFTVNDDIKDLGLAPVPIVPTPLSYVIENEKTLSLGEKDWTIVAVSLLNEANFLQAGIADHGLPVPAIASNKPSTKFIHLVIGNPEVGDNNATSTSPEAYSLNVEPGSQTIEIKALNAKGIFYGVQSLLSFVKKSKNGQIPKAMIKDAPRFQYRGMHLDVGRNFHPNTSVLRLLDAMAMYKMNRFHFHLSDDEGWRLEIPGLEELTQIGSNRCSDMTEKSCIIPQLGSGPDTTTSGSGFYTIDDYKEILEYAAKRHIEVIPEFDMPGHAHAAIKSMEARSQRLTDIGETNENANYFLLHDPTDKSHYMSVQNFNDNAINPCIETTYNFVRYVAQQVKAMHDNINPLKVFHFGGDEVASGAWLNSTACNNLDQSVTSLKETFTKRVSGLTHSLNLNLGGWEDGLIEKNNIPFNRSVLSNKEVYGYAWSNVWEWGAASRAYVMANLGYKVVIASATNYYFDHPYESDPEERGFYWATRYTTTKDVFSFMPERLYDNAEMRTSGDPISKEDFCGEDFVNCPSLEKSENLVGIQGNLWSETIRTPEQMDYMIFPRMLALAERSWFKGDWENMDDKEARNKARDAEWTRFSNTLGYGEMKILDGMGIKYRVPPPGAKIRDNKLYVNSEIPGLTVSFSKDDGKTWNPVSSDGISVNGGDNIQLVTWSADKQRKSRETSLKVPQVSSAPRFYSNIPLSAIIILMLCIVFH
ncbi:uncharacterized protein LOC126826788 [Patella vulgata]|uniref:uncharacterized protein LOC126826788 n=1 Tax=Patella vulgata TaxID=6465 RepID=UPI00217F2F14|nr:uncharacterized protein LOC126826788 [Patella vulgata]